MSRRLAILTVYLTESVGAIAGGGKSLSVRGAAWGGSRVVDFIEPTSKGYLVGDQGRVYVVHDSRVDYVEVIDQDAQEPARPPPGPIIEPAFPDVAPARIAPPSVRPAPREVLVGNGEMFYDTVSGVFRRVNPSPPLEIPGRLEGEGVAATPYQHNGRRAHPSQHSAGPEFSPPGLDEAIAAAEHRPAPAATRPAAEPDQSAQIAALQAQLQALQGQKAAPVKSKPARKRVNGKFVKAEAAE